MQRIALFAFVCVCSALAEGQKDTNLYSLFVPRKELRSDPSKNLKAPKVPIGGVLKVELEVAAQEQNSWKKKSALSMDLGPFASIRVGDEGALKMLSPGNGEVEDGLQAFRFEALKDGNTLLTFERDVQNGQEGETVKVEVTTGTPSKQHFDSEYATKPDTQAHNPQPLSPPPVPVPEQEEL